MGGVAASGGYYISAPADAIWAEPTTVTGSIGIYLMLPSFERVFDDVGIHQTTVKHGKNANIYSSSTPWSEEQMQRMDELIGQSYDQFKARVVGGRNLSIEQVEAVAKGRVWSGEAAMAHGLVDRMGGIREAIEDARRRAGIPEKSQVEIIQYQTKNWPLDLGTGNWLGALSTQISYRRSGPELPESVRRLTETLVVMDILRKERVWMISPWFPFEQSP